MYVIQTNQSLNTFGKPKDFQSCIYKYESHVPKEYEWCYFKDLIKIGGKKSPELKGTMRGIYIGGKTPVEIIIDDDFHLEVLYKNSENHYTKSQYCLITEDQFKNLLN